MPLLSIVPQVGSQESDNGLAVWSATVVELELGCTNFHCCPVAGEFKNDALSESFCAGVIPTGAVTLEGVTETRIPESKVIAAVPVLLLFASACAVNVMVGAGLGNAESAGAV